MDYQLLVVRGRSASDALKLADGVTTVGRHDECQIRIKSSQVSRRHCEIFEKKGLLLVKDLGSANGTVVNGKRIKDQQILEPGDELTIGGVSLRVAKIGQTPPVKTPDVPAAGDTAVVAAIAPTSGGDDDFEIDFDEEPSVEPVPVEIDPEPVAEKPSPSAAPEPMAPRPAPAISAASKKAPEVHPAPSEADEAIANFLLDIKLDDDE